MSYILDALRRADAERERGHVPGIHAQPTRQAVAGAVASTTHRPWLWGLVALLLMALAGLSWRVLGLEAGAPAGAVVAGSSPASSSANGPAAPVAVEPTVAVPPPGVDAVAPPLTPGPVLPNTAQIKKTASAAVHSRARPDARASAAAASSATVYTAEDLPEDIRRELPKLAIGGSIYSESAASRFVIVNGQLLHEGDTLMPGLVLQQIKLKSAVLAFRGYRYRIAL